MTLSSAVWTEIPILRCLTNFIFSNLELFGNAPYISTLYIAHISKSYTSLRVRNWTSLEFPALCMAELEIILIFSVGLFQVQWRHFFNYFWKSKRKYLSHLQGQQKRHFWNFLWSQMGTLFTFFGRKLIILLTTRGQQIGTFFAFSGRKL